MFCFLGRKWLELPHLEKKKQTNKQTNKIKPNQNQTKQNKTKPNQTKPHQNKTKQKQKLMGKKLSDIWFCHVGPKIQEWFIKHETEPYGIIGNVQNTIDSSRLWNHFK